MGLENNIEKRIGQKTMGFGADIKTKKERKVGELLSLTQPEDLLKYGLIPEFIGRLPVIATLEDLDEKALVRILTEPKNAIIKQYERLFAFEKVSLRFTEDALTAIAKNAISKKTGARGLRAILEDVMLDLMYEVPSQKNVKDCIINADAINKKSEPILIYEKDAKSA